LSLIDTHIYFIATSEAIERHCSIESGGRGHEVTWVTWAKGSCHNAVTVLAVTMEELREIFEGTQDGITYG
jgi:hypothetical protein